MPIRIAVDAMGGDDAPEVVVEGAVRAARAAAGGSLEIQLFGPTNTLEDVLAKHENASGLSIVEAPDVIGMAESPSQALRQKTNSSIHLGLGTHAQRGADAFVSAGNTGAVMAASLHILGRVEGVARPTVIGLFPSTRGWVVVLDVGTNVDCKAEHLVQFACMGSVYAERILNVNDPSVGLLNVGEEPGKGNALARESYPLFESDGRFRFVGNVEGRDIFAHAADVVVCDGFVGNVVLKMGESVAGVLPQMIARSMAENNVPADEQRIVAKVFGAVGKRFSYEEQGGAPLLGVRGNVIIGHGGSTPLAVTNMINAAVQLASRGVHAALESAMTSTA